MNSNADHSKSLKDTYNDIFGDSNADEDVSLESALKASRMPKKQVEKVKVFDTELGWVEEWVTVETPVESKTGTLTEVVAQYGETFPENVVVTFKSWKGERRITSVSDMRPNSCYAIVDGGKTTLNPDQQVTVTVNS